jgi:hypothetical protein
MKHGKGRTTPAGLFSLRPMAFLKPVITISLNFRGIMAYKKVLTGVGAVALFLASLFFMTDLSAQQDIDLKARDERNAMISANQPSMPSSLIPPVDTSAPEHTMTATFALG